MTLFWTAPGRLALAETVAVDTQDAAKEARALIDAPVGHDVEPPAVNAETVSRLSMRLLPVGCQKSAWRVSCSDGLGPAVGHDVRVPPTALPHLRPALRWPVLPRPVIGLQGRGVARAAARDRRASPHLHPRPRLAWADPCGPRRADPAPAGEAAGTGWSPPARPAVASPSGHPEVDLPEPDRGLTSRPPVPPRAFLRFPVCPPGSPPSPAFLRFPVVRRSPVRPLRPLPRFRFPSVSLRVPFP